MAWWGARLESAEARGASRALLRTRGVLRPEVRDLKVSESGLGEGATRVRGSDNAQNASADSHVVDQSV